MATRLARLGDPDAPDAPFIFKIGDRVAWKRWDGSPDEDMSGVVIGGHCEYVSGGWAYRSRYIVQRFKDGFYFAADDLDVVRLPER